MKTIQNTFTLIAALFISISIFSKEIEVKEGSSIQKAVEEASPGDTVKVYPGIYHEFVYVDKPNIRLIGVIQDGKWPRLEGRNKLNDGIIASGSGFYVEGFHISNYRANGVMTQAANDVVIRKLMIDHTGIYGIYPTLGTNILIEDTVSWGIADAAIYVGMCKNTDVRRNEVFDNVSGIEIENSSNILVEENTVYNNTAGILVFTLPGLPTKSSVNIIVRNNIIFENNHKNFAAKGAIVGNVPPGIGLMILSSDKVTLEKNIIRRNSLAGIVVADKSALPPSKKPDPDADPAPDDLKILDNLFYENGTRNWSNTFTWLHFIFKIIFEGGTPPSIDDGSGKGGGIFPEGKDIIAVGGGENNCVLQKNSMTSQGISKWTICGESSTQKMATTIGQRIPIEAVKNIGAQVYAAICSGCHAMGVTRIGPPVTEIQLKYANNPTAIVKFATEPMKVRQGFPDMPSQKYLGVEKLSEVAKYMLQLK
ncbi:MAG: right-handed parallel beta-helix repeat-containing protein [Leptospiraceae bacterium]|nr:right-handed parallel beta-helix repeat-containing protein [Leptospiraceae bacterium]MCK6381980.1 right-handed parallel beta-helix repeat-containing protein [Leptospiraceae bacterium]